MTLKDVTDYLYYGFLGNRVAAIGTGILLNTYNLSKIYTQAEDLAPIESIISTMIIIPLGYFGLYCAATTLLGASTYSHYKRTKKHIEKFGELKPKFVKTVIFGSENDTFMGYCQLQGTYLAAREFGELDVFKEMKKKYSNNKIPNF